jgi:hypothetical protein
MSGIAHNEVGRGGFETRPYSVGWPTNNVDAEIVASVEPGQPPRRSRGMAGYPPRRSDGLDAALAIHLALYCAVGACFALGFYLLLQPSRSANPGLAAYQPPPATVMTVSVPSLGEAAADAPASLAGAPERIAAASPRDTAELSTTGQGEAKQPEREAKPAKAKRPRTASRKPRRNPHMDYAAQPFGGFRPWF